MCDFATNYTSLQVQWASQANCTQRKGKKIQTCANGNKIKAQQVLKIFLLEGNAAACLIDCL